MFVVWNFKHINWEHVEFDEGKSQILPFLVVYHILSETPAWIVQRCNISYIGIIIYFSDHETSNRISDCSIEWNGRPDKPDLIW